MMFLIFLSILHLTSTHANKTNDAGGADTSIVYHPYYVSLEYSNQTICGGVIISPLSVLTAASCKVINIERLVIRAGSDRRETGGTIHQVHQFISHINFTSSKHGSDIAMIHVRKAFEFDNSCKPIPMFVADEEVKLGSIADVSSFAETNNKLKQIPFLIVNDTLCSRVSNHLVPGTFCASSFVKDVCLGITGSPVIIDSRLAGVMSNGINCNKYPAIVTKVASFSSWIWRETY